MCDSEVHYHSFESVPDEFKLANSAVTIFMLMCSGRCSNNTHSLTPTSEDLARPLLTL